MSEENETTGVTHHLSIQDAIGGSDQAMVIKWPNDLELDKKLFEGINKASELLRAELGRSQASATAEWIRVNGGAGRPVLQLKLTDLFTQNHVTEQFTDEEFGDRRQLENRLHRMWGNLLRARSGGIVKSLESIINRSGG